NTGNRANYNPSLPLNLDWNNYYRGQPIFNAAAFSDPGLWTPGNSPRTLPIIRQPFNHNENVNLAKHFYFGERVEGELRMEFFNVLNRVSICGPDFNVSNGPPSAGGTFGLINGGTTPCQANTPRHGQAFFKITF